MAARNVGITMAMALSFAACSGGGGGGGGGGGPIDPQTGAVQGRVAAGGTGVAGASVALGSATRTTDGSGDYQFGSVAVGTHSVTLTLPAGFQLAPGEQATKSVTVTAGQTARADWALQQDAGNAVVEIHLTTGLRFSPEDVTINPGTTVRWINDASVAHTVTPDNTSQPGVWSSVSTSSPGTVLEHTFTESGQQYGYHCQPHQAQGMTGVIRVN